MRLDLGALAPAPTAFVANLPYNVAAPLILRSIDALPGVRTLVLPDPARGRRPLPGDGRRRRLRGAERALRARLRCRRPPRGLALGLRAACRTSTRPSSRSAGAPTGAELRRALARDPRGRVGGLRTPTQDARELARAGRLGLARRDRADLRGDRDRPADPGRGAAAPGVPRTRDGTSRGARVKATRTGEDQPRAARRSAAARRLPRAREPDRRARGRGRDRARAGSQHDGRGSGRSRAATRSSRARSSCSRERSGHAAGSPCDSTSACRPVPGWAVGAPTPGVALRLANRLLAAPLEQAALVALAAEVGSDVPFFAAGHAAAEMRGRGESVRAVRLHARPVIAVAWPGVPVSTADVYAGYSTAWSEHGFARAADSIALAARADLRTLTALVANDLSDVAERLCPASAALRRELRARGALVATVAARAARCSGSSRHAETPRPRSATFRAPPGRPFRVCSSPATMTSRDRVPGEAEGRLRHPQEGAAHRRRRPSRASPAGSSAIASSSRSR